MSDELELIKDETSNHQDQLTAWGHGWYVYEDGQVSGPLNAKDALGSEKSANGQTVRMVSRKGFTQWYPVRDFAEIYSMIEAYSKRLDEKPASPKPATTEFTPKSKIINTNVGEGLSLNSGVSVQSESLGRSEALKNHGSPSSNILETMGSATQTPGEIGTATRSPTIPRNAATESNAAVSPPAGLPHDDKKLKKLLRRQVRQAQAAARNQKLMDPKLFAERYFGLQSRLRLGRVFSPTLGALIYTPLTLGGYWWDWFVRACDEVGWHLTGSVKAKMSLPLWFCMIPGLHLFVAYSLAMAVRQMEMQNGYRSTNTFLATLAAVFPPLYMIMIQSALNKHWRLHVYHSGVEN
ncbi:MAG: hypothetical protein WCL28_06295 [bacterium]